MDGTATRNTLWVALCAGLLLVVHNFGINLLPRAVVPLEPSRMQAYGPAGSHAYRHPLAAAVADAWPSPRSRVWLYEDGVPYALRCHAPDEVVQVGGLRFAHEPGAVIFSASDNTDPRTNGRRYSARVARLYSDAIGWIGAAVASVSALLLARRRAAAAPWPAAPVPRWALHRWGALGVLLLGLYVNTGSLAPYAVTFAPYVDPDTGYAYNQDHPHFRVLFDFLNGADRSVWDHALLLRRILFPVMAFPFMKVLGFEVGGTIAALALNAAAFWLLVGAVRRRIGERGAVLAAWLLAFYPGAAYWAGLPYSYAVIVPFSFALMFGLMELDEGPAAPRLATVSLAMGIAYLGYDLGIFFLPASFLVLVLRRRPFAAVASCALQVAPLALWIAVLRFGLGQSLKNGNSGIYAGVIGAWANLLAPGRLVQLIAGLPSVAADAFFSANFLFLPAVFIAAVAAAAGSGTRLRRSEAALLASAGLVFLAVNLAPVAAGSWNMGGTWISRLYQPVLPAMVLFLARWWENVRLSRPGRLGWIALIAAACAGNALVVAGPILRDPLGVSTEAFYRFYDHTDAHFLYLQNLDHLGRRPLGFTRPQPRPPTAAQQQQAQRALLVSLEDLIRANAVLAAQNESAARENARALADLRWRRYQANPSGYPRAAGEAAPSAPRDLLPPEWKVLLDPAPAVRAAAPAEPGSIDAAIVAANGRLKAEQERVHDRENLLRAVIETLRREQAAP